MDSMKDNPYVKEFEGEFYAPCWLEENTMGGLLSMFVSYTGGGGWHAQFRFVNVKDIGKDVAYLRSFDRAYEIPYGTWLTPQFLDMLWNHSITKSRKDYVQTSQRYIQIDLLNHSLEFVAGMINAEAESKREPVDVLVIDNCESFLDPKKKSPPKMVKCVNGSFI